MANRNMYAIEYNLYNTLIQLVTDKLPSVLPLYNMGSIDRVDIIPSYPRDLSELFKPSIIIRKVDIEKSTVAMGNFIGQIEDPSLGLLDVKAMNHDILMQFDVITNSNIQTQMIMSLLTEGIFDSIMIDEDSRGSFQLYNYVNDFNNPTPMGAVTIRGRSDIVNLHDNPKLNNDYISVFRCSFNIIQTIVPVQKSIDLSKWIKQSIIIRTNN